MDKINKSVRVNTTEGDDIVIAADRLYFGNGGMLMLLYFSSKSKLIHSKIRMISFFDLQGISDQWVGYQRLEK